MNKIQELQFELMRLSSFNEFDGNLVVDSLLANPHLWEGVIMDRMDLIKLRDMSGNYWNVDTIYILSSGKDDIELEKLAETWGADEVHFLPTYEASSLLGTSNPKNKVLCVWFE